MQREVKPRIAITMGDPAGIGPEIVLKALQNPALYEKCEPVVFGDWKRIRVIARELFFTASILPEGEAEAGPHSVIVRQATDADLTALEWGTISAEAGKAAAQSVIAATQAVLNGEFDAIVTPPLNKEAMVRGGYDYPGHTELLAAVTGTPRYGMLLVADKLRVIHVSTHVSLREAIERVKTARVLECIQLGYRACQDLGIENPQIAAAGLNPHAGENGLFGIEDTEDIAPAVAMAQAEGIAASGPHSPDTVFARAVQGEFDLVVAMYHDQGHIPIKLHGFDSGVNITVGLPVIRVSVDHGTAFAIAGQNLAREDSLLEAIRVAITMVHAKRKN